MADIEYIEDHRIFEPGQTYVLSPEDITGTDDPKDADYKIKIWPETEERAHKEYLQWWITTVSTLSLNQS